MKIILIVLFNICLLLIAIEDLIYYKISLWILILLIIIKTLLASLDKYLFYHLLSLGILMHIGYFLDKRKMLSMGDIIVLQLIIIDKSIIYIKNHIILSIIISIIFEILYNQYINITKKPIVFMFGIIQLIKYCMILFKIIE